VARRIHRALGSLRTVVNVGAGSGSYEPLERYVIAIEPSDAMAGQRPGHLAPAIRASAGALPLRDHGLLHANGSRGMTRDRVGWSRRLSGVSRFGRCRQ
jgi:hypothetical protein